MPSPRRAGSYFSSLPGLDTLPAAEADFREKKLDNFERL
jgi:hypothetical protein